MGQIETLKSTQKNMWEFVNIVHGQRGEAAITYKV